MKEQLKKIKEILLEDSQILEARTLQAHVLYRGMVSQNTRESLLKLKTKISEGHGHTIYGYPVSQKTGTTNYEYGGWVRPL